MRLPALGFGGKLLLAFLGLLAPMLALLLVGYEEDLSDRQEALLDDHLLAAQAIAAQVGEAFDGAATTGWAVAANPQVRALDPSVEETLREVAARAPTRIQLALHDRTGRLVAASHRRPGRDVGDEPWFRQVLATGLPALSDVHELPADGIGATVGVPVGGEDGVPVGVIAVELPAREVALRYEEARLRAGQGIVLVDREGRAAFDTLARDISWEEAGAFRDVPPLRAALGGVPAAAPSVELPFATGPQLAAFAPTPRHGWAVGVFTPRAVALAAAHDAFRRRLGIFAVVLVISLLLARALARALAAPVRRLEEVARAIGAGDLARRVDVRTGDELERLGHSFNEMAADLGRREAEVEGLRAEAESRARQLEAVIESIGDGVFVRSVDGDVFTSNAAGRELLGLEARDGSVGVRGWFDVRQLDGTPLPRHLSPMRRALAGDTFAHVPTLLRRREGSERTLEVSGAPVRDEAGRIVLGVVVARDVTAQRRGEQEREALARITRALVGELELDRVVHLAVAEGSRLVGVEALGLFRADEVRRELTLLAHTPVSPESMARMARFSYDAESLSARAARTRRPVVVPDVGATDAPATSFVARREGMRSVVAMPLVARGRLVGVATFSRYRPHSLAADDLAFIGTVADLFAVALDTAELYADTRAAVRVREEFMAAAAHELRTPVTTIRTWAQVLLRTEPDPATEKRALGAIERQTDRIARLIDGLLLSVRLRATAPELNRERLDLAGLVEKARGSSSLAPSAGRISLVRGGPLLVDADPVLIERMLIHAIDDALRAQPGDEPIEVRTVAAGGEARVGIRFESVPVPPERQARFFEPFFEPAPPGAPGYVGQVSIGPYLGRLVAEAHGGRVWLESDQRTTTTWLALPLAPTGG